MRLDGVVIGCLMQWARSYSKRPVSVEIFRDFHGRVICQIFDGGQILAETRIQ